MNRKKIMLLVIVIALVLTAGCTKSVKELELGELKLKGQYQDEADSSWLKTANNFIKNLELFYETYQSKDKDRIVQSYELINMETSNIKDKVDELANINFKTKTDNELKSLENIITYSQDAIKIGLFLNDKVQDVIKDAARDVVAQKNDNANLTEDDNDFLEELEARINDFADKYYSK